MSGIPVYCRTSLSLYNLSLDPFKCSICGMFYWFVKEVREDGDDCETGDGRTPSLDAGVLHVHKCLLCLFDGSMNCERWQSPMYDTVQL